MYLVRWYPLELLDEKEEFYPAPEGCDWVSSIDFIRPNTKNWDFNKADMQWVKEMLSKDNLLAIFKRHNDESWSNERYCCISQKTKVLKNVEIWESEQKGLGGNKTTARKKRSSKPKKTA